jgi:hypothetical protein
VSGFASEVFDEDELDSELPPELVHRYRLTSFLQVLRLSELGRGGTPRFLDSFRHYSGPEVPFARGLSERASLRQR